MITEQKQEAINSRYKTAERPELEGDILRLIMSNVTRVTTKDLQVKGVDWEADYNGQHLYIDAKVDYYQNGNLLVYEYATGHISAWTDADMLSTHILYIKLAEGRAWLIDKHALRAAEATEVVQSRYLWSCYSAYGLTTQYRFMAIDEDFPSVRQFKFEPELISAKYSYSRDVLFHGRGKNHHEI